MFISLSLHDLPVYCPLTTGPILLLSLLMHQQAWPPSVTRGVLSRTVSHTQFQFHGERTGPGQAWLGCPRLVQGTAHWSVSGSGMRVASPKGARPGQTEFQKLPAGLWAWVACGRGTEVRTGALSARSCTGRGVRDLLGPIPHRPPHVELRVPLDRGPAPGLPVRALRGKDRELEKQTRGTRDRNQGRSDGRDPRKGKVKSRAGGTLWRKSEGLAACPAFFLGVGWDLSKKGEFVKEGY